METSLSAQRELWDNFAPNIAKPADPEAVPAFAWTQYPSGHGPGLDVFGDAREVMDLGYGGGANLVALLQAGFDVTGVDLSPVMRANAVTRWPDVDASRFVNAEAIDHLDSTTRMYDAMYSVFGAMWFTAPQVLLPAVRSRLRRGGLLAFSHAPAIEGCYGPQGMYKGGFTAKALYLRRYCYTPAQWTAMLQRHSFRQVQAEIIDAPEPGHVPTLFVRAVAG